ncbi:MAG: DUF504 domain-containing protein [Candidatus Aenigmarchaeota archaeon]|nr:DUF504 domain-containing protein [Candidatus Aenigmarchaeota archaeon]
MVFQTLNRLKWTGRLEKCTVTIVSRGFPGDVKKISGKNITEVKRDHFVFSERGKETFIPHHRVKRIRIDGETIWRRNSKKGCFGPFAFLRKTCL